MHSYHLLATAQAHAISGHKSQGQTLEQILIAGLFRISRQTGNMTCLLRGVFWRGWMYTALSRTVSRYGLQLQQHDLPADHIRERRYDVLAEVARLQVLHERTRAFVWGGSGADAAENEARLARAEAAETTARKRFNRSR